MLHFSHNQFLRTFFSLYSSLKSGRNGMGGGERMNIKTAMWGAGHSFTKKTTGTFLQCCKYSALL